jgi:hypothetical protein
MDVFSFTVTVPHSHLQNHHERALNVNYVIMFLNFYCVTFPGFLIDCSFGPVAHFACPNLAMAWWRASNQLVPQVLLRYLKSRVPVNLSTVGNLQQRRMKKNAKAYTLQVMQVQRRQQWCEVVPPPR